MQKQSNYFVYVHCKPDGTPFYVGKGNDERVKYIRRNNTYHTNVVLKYGLDNLKVTTYPCESEKQAFELECELIYILRNMLGVKLVNVTNGGEGASGYKFDPLDVARRASQHSIIMKGRKHLESTKIKIAEKSKGRIKMPEELQKISLANTGKKRTPEQCQNIVNGNPGPKGYRHTEEAKLKITASLMGRFVAPETREKISLANTGYQHTEESKEKNRQWHLGRKQSEETKEKRATKHRGRKNTPETRALMALKAKEREAKKRLLKMENQIPGHGFDTDTLEQAHRPPPKPEE